MRKWVKEHIVEMIVVASIAVVFGVVAFGIIDTKNNDMNKISEGIITDKYYRAAYTSTTTQRISKNVTMPVTQYHPATYHFKIEGNKDGKIVEYVFAVTENEYNAYKIGDYYNR